MKHLTILLASIVLAVSLLITITLTLSETVTAQELEIQELPGITDIEMTE